EAGGVETIHFTLDGELDAGDCEAAVRIRAQRDVCSDVESLRRTAGLGDLVRQRHRITSGVRGGDQLFRTGGTGRGIRGALGEAGLVGPGAGAGQLDLAGAFLQGAVPGSASGASWHVVSFVATNDFPTNSTLG